MEKKIDFTVLVPVFNTKAAELIETIDSVSMQKQTIKQEYKILIVDDGSTNPETGHALEYLKRKMGDDINIIYMASNGGTSAALNKGHELIETEWIALTGSSDISLVTRFEKQVNHLMNNPDIDVLGTQLTSFNENDPFRKSMFTSTHQYEETLQRRTEGWLVNHGTVFYKNQAVKDVGGYLIKGRGQDVELWKRMLKAKKKLRTLNEVLYLWRRAVPK